MSDPAYRWGLDELQSIFRTKLNRLRGSGAKVLELGTCRQGKHPTHHRGWLPTGVEHWRTDIEAGVDVDHVADAHELEVAFPDVKFDAAIAASVWEHLARPWVAAESLARVCRPGAPILIETHHTFPVHGYPSDYTRWTDEGLRELFSWAGFTNIRTSFAFPCQIIPPDEVLNNWNPAAPAYLNVALTATR